MSIKGRIINHETTYISNDMVYTDVVIRVQQQEVDKLFPTGRVDHTGQEAQIKFAHEKESGAVS